MKDEVMDIASELERIHIILLYMDGEDAEDELPPIAAQVDELAGRLSVLANQLQD